MTASVASCCDELAQQGHKLYRCPTCSTLVLRVKFSKTQQKFLQSEADIVWAVSSQGEGKTFAGTIAMLYHASQQPTRTDPVSGEPIPVHWAYVRDTAVNIKNVSVPYWRQNFPGVFSFHQDYHLMRAPNLTVDLLGMDNEAALNRIQGAEYDGIWIEEPAPMLAGGLAGGAVNVGIQHAVFKACLARLRGQETTKRLQITMNPADKSHWTFYERELSPPPGLRTESFRFAPGENPHITEQDRQRVRAAYRDNPGAYRRYVLGQESETYIGQAVASNYNPDIHKAAFTLDPILGAQNFITMDGGLNPTAVLFQISPAGRIHLLDAVLMENNGMEQMIDTKLIPLLNSPRWRKVTRFRATGDPSLKNREQSNSDHSAMQVIESKLKRWITHFEPGVDDWDLRREALQNSLAKMHGGLPYVLVNPTITEGEPFHRIHAALAGGYAYKMVNGQVQTGVPDKASIHCVDEETEILTLNGWKRHDQLVIGEAVYAVGQDSRKRRKLILSTVRNIHRYEGDIPALHFTNQSLDMLVTMNHRCLVEGRWTPGLQFVEAADLTGTHYLLRAASYRDQLRPWYSNAFVRLCAWVMTEGSYARNGAIHIVQSEDSNPEYCQEIDQLVRRCGGYLSGKRSSQGHAPGTRIWCWSVGGEYADLIRWMMPNKIPSMAFINRMTGSQRRLFLYEVIRGDGTWESGDQLPAPPEKGWNRNELFFHRPTTPRIFQKSRQAIDALQMIAVLAGMRAPIRRKGWRDLFEGWSLSLTREGAWTSVDKCEKTTKVLPRVWCPETEHGSWVARRNGMVYITGNSHVGDAITHAFAYLFRDQGQAPLTKPDHTATKRRAGGYGVGISSAK